MPLWTCWSVHSSLPLVPPAVRQQRQEYSQRLHLDPPPAVLSPGAVYSGCCYPLPRGEGQSHRHRGPEQPPCTAVRMMPQVSVDAGPPHTDGGSQLHDKRDPCHPQSLHDSRVRMGTPPFATCPGTPCPAAPISPHNHLHAVVASRGLDVGLCRGHRGAMGGQHRRPLQQHPSAAHCCRTHPWDFEAAPTTFPHLVPRRSHFIPMYTARQI